MKPEFQIGDEVTYKPYEQAIPAKVLDVLPPEGHRPIRYVLGGTARRYPLPRIETPARFIAESINYDPS